MALDVTPVNRNLHTKVTFMGLEFEDLFVVMALAAVMNLAGHFVSGEVGGIPLSVLLQYGVPLLCIPLRMIFMYGKPRGYLTDLMKWRTQPKKYCAAARDRKVTKEYLKEEEECR